MAFDVLEAVVSAARAGRPASVGLTCFKGGGRPRCAIGLSKEFAAKAGIAAEDRFVLLLGTEEHKGFVRLRRSATGPLRPKLVKGGATFNCGHIDRFGTAPEPKQFCDAQLTEEGDIEIRLPPWGMDQDV